MNVVIVGLDDEFCATFSKTIADFLQLEYINFETYFDDGLLFLNDYPLEDANTQFNQIEKEKLKELLNKNNIVISLNNSTFLSNQNYNLFNNHLTICVEKVEVDKILKNIQKLIKNHCKITINQEITNNKQIKNLLSNYFANK